MKARLTHSPRYWAIVWRDWKHRPLAELVHGSLQPVATVLERDGTSTVHTRPTREELFDVVADELGRQGFEVELPVTE